MLNQANRLHQVILNIFFFLLYVFISIKYKPIGLFLSSADEIFGPITTLRRDNRVVKHVPWSAFKLGNSDWERVVDVRDILDVCEVFCSLFGIKLTHIMMIYRTLIRFSNTFLPKKQPTLWCVLPALEDLQSKWEKKRDSPRFDLYKDALTDGLEKLKKYYFRLDEKPSFVLALGKFSV